MTHKKNKNQSGSRQSVTPTATTDSREPRARAELGLDNDGLDVAGGDAPHEDLAVVTCGDCLRRIAAYGDIAARRLR